MIAHVRLMFTDTTNNEKMTVDVTFQSHLDGRHLCRIVLKEKKGKFTTQITLNGLYLLTSAHRGTASKVMIVSRLN